MYIIADDLICLYNDLILITYLALLFKILSFEYNIILICDILLCWLSFFCLFGVMFIIYDMLFFYNNLSIVV